MKRKVTNEVRTLLRAAPDGMTPPKLQKAVGCAYTSIDYALKHMPDAYIDRWEPTPRAHHGHLPVYCVVVPPPNCPHPRGKA